MMLEKFTRNFLRNDLGVAAILFALSVPVIIGSAGVGVDLAKAYHTKNKLEKTLDAAVLAGASSNLTGTALEDFIEDYVESNFKVTSYSDVDISSLSVVENATDKTIMASATATSQNTFMPFFGEDYVTVAAEAMSKEKLTGVEVVLVLDDSQSMSFFNRSRDLRSAAKRFVDVLYDTASVTGGEFKIGIVPYGSFVNVGPYGLGETLTGAVYGSGTPFVNNPMGLDYTDVRHQREDAPNWAWSGCVLEHDHYDTGAHSPNWDMYFFCHDETGTRITTGDGQCRSHDSVGGRGYWDPAPVYGPPRGCRRVNTVDGVVVSDYWDPNCNRPLISRGTYIETSPARSVPRIVNIHQYCPSTIIRPMMDSTSPGSRGTLKADIDKLSGASGAKTNSNLGMIWAYEMLSPEFPLEEGSEWGSSRWTKVIVFMTDGNIQADRNYDAYYQKDPNRQSQRTARSQTRFEEACNLAKSKGILVYTVQFEGGDPLDATNQTLLEDCATDSAKALRASSGAALYDTFEDIAEDLGNIYLAR